MLLLIGAVLLSQLIVIVIFFLKIETRTEYFRQSSINDALTAVYQQIATADAEQGKAIARRLSNRENEFRVIDQPLSTTLANKSQWIDIQMSTTTGEIINGKYHEGETSLRELWGFWFSDEWLKCVDIIGLQAIGSGCPYTFYEFPLTQKRWLFVAENSGPNVYMILAPVILSASLSLIIISYGVLLAVRKITLPMQQLNVAAQRFGRGEKAQTVPLSGSEEIRQTITAFNNMQYRIGRFVTDRTRMLAAISHDLRTPITSLRLRAEFVGDEVLRDKMIRTLEDMQTMVESCLAFTREESLDEAFETVDLIQLLSELADDSSFITFESQASQYLFSCQRIKLTRALVNLLDNAVKYGSRAVVSLKIADTVVINIDDFGPGIPQDQFENVFEPFVRLDKARNTEGASVGLGLSIARTIIHQHGGDIALSDIHSGLRVTVRLPVS